MINEQYKTQMISVLLQLNRIGRTTVMKLADQIQDIPVTLQAVKDILANNVVAVHRSYSDDEITAAIAGAQKLSSLCQQQNIAIISYADREYPERCRSIPLKDRPALLYCKGSIDCLNAAHTLAIIGTRSPSEYGKRVSERLGQVFTEKGYVIISGLALGCDSGGERGCVKADGKAVSVLPCAIDRVYPTSNLELADQTLKKGGCLISEYPPGSRMTKGLFVERDRLQAALSDGVIAVETDTDGGTMHAVRKCLEYGRILGCFDHPDPYRNLPQARGTQQLIRDGLALPLGNRNDLDQFHNEVYRKGKDDTPQTDK